MAQTVSLAETKVARYLDITRRALDKLRIVAPEPSYARRIADDFLGMATSYFDDAVSFHGNGDLVNAFACANYAHGWLDAGARLGVFDVGQDDVLFTLLD